MKPKSVKLLPYQIKAMVEFIRTERSGALSDDEKDTLQKLFELAKEVVIKF